MLPGAKPGFEKGGGGFFERVRKLQTTLTRIFIVLESESHGLSDFGRFILKIETEISTKVGNSNAFSAQKQVVSKKKRSSPKLRRIFRPKSEIQTLFQPKNRWSQKKRSSPKLRRISRPKLEIQTLFQAESRHLLHNFGTQFPLRGRLFSFFHQKSASKAPKTCEFAYFTGQWGGGSSPPWLRYWMLPISRE